MKTYQNLPRTYRYLPYPVDGMGLINNYKFLKKFDNISTCVESLHNIEIENSWSLFIDQAICYIHDKLGEFIFL